MEIEFSAENFQTEMQSQQKTKLLNNTKLGKKTVLRPNKGELKETKNNINQDDQLEIDIENEEVIVIKNDIPNMKNEQENNSTFLLKTIIKAFYLSIWKRKIKSMKYISRGYNPRRLNFKKFINSISSVIKQHKYDYLNEILENMESLPMPENVNHDYNFGKLRIVDKEILSKKCSDKILLLAENNYYNKINGFKNYLLEAFKKIKENNNVVGQINQNMETDYSNYERYNPNNEIKDKKNEQNIIEYKMGDSIEFNENNLDKENIDININTSNEYTNINNDTKYINEKYFNDYNNNIKPQNMNQNYYMNELNINYNNEMNNIEEPKRIYEKDEYQINNNYNNENYDYAEEENNYIENNNYVQNTDNINYIEENNYDDTNYVQDTDNNNYIEDNNYDGNNYIEYNNYMKNIDSNIDNNNYIEEKNYVEDNNYINNNYNGYLEEKTYLINESDKKENDYNNNDFIDNEYTESEFNTEKIYYYKDDKEYDYNNNDYNENELKYDELDNYEANKYIQNNYVEEDAYDNSYAISNYNNNNINIPYIENNNYEIQEYNKTNYDNYIYPNQNQYNLNNYENEDNYNNYSVEEYDNDYNNYYNNEQNFEEENYYYEEPNIQMNNKEVTYYLPYNSQNQKGFSYITREGNNVLVSDVYTKPKISNNHSKISIHNFNNYRENNNYEYSNYEYKVQKIVSNNSEGAKKRPRAFPYRDDNHAFYISK